MNEYGDLAPRNGRRPFAAVSRPVTWLFALALLVALVAPAIAAEPISQSEGVGEMPTTGGLRPGPLGFDPPQMRNPGVRPIAIKIERAQVDAEIEVTEIVQGVMQNPSGPFVVSWYKETARLGEFGNVVMAGHVDFWNVGEAVFYNLRDLKEKDLIEVTGTDKEVYTYEVDWVENYQVAQLDPTKIEEIVGATEDENLTLITCGGPFDVNTGEYLERMVVRAHRVT
jgi:LPXTG-site transpeptidase (sortase) family protein